MLGWGKPGEVWADDMPNMPAECAVKLVKLASYSEVTLRFLRKLLWAHGSAKFLTRHLPSLCCALCCDHCRSIDQLNRERKLQQSTAGSELRVLEDQYYSALRKNLEISAACQAVEDDMALLQARVDKLTKTDEQQPQQDGMQQGDGAAEKEHAQQEGEQQQEGKQGEQEQPLQNGVADGPAAGPAADDAIEQ